MSRVQQEKKKPHVSAAVALLFLTVDDNRDFSWRDFNLIVALEKLIHDDMLIQCVLLSLCEQQGLLSIDS